MYYVESEVSRDLIAGFIHDPPAPTENFQLHDITAALIVGFKTLAKWHNNNEDG